MQPHKKKENSTYPFTHSRDSKTETIVQTLREFGIAHVPHFLDPQTLAGLCNEYHALLTHNRDGVESMDYESGLGAAIRKRGHLNTDLFPITGTLFTSKFMDDISRAYLQSDVALNHEIFITKDQHSPDAVNTANHLQLHFDRLNTLKFFLYLKDTTAAEGAFECIPGSQLQTAKLRRYYLQRGASLFALPNQNVFASMQPTPIEGPAGTIIIFDTDVWHRGGIVQQNHERFVMRGHTRTYPRPSYSPGRFTRQWFRESPYNPARYEFRLYDALVKPVPPNRL